MKKLFIFFLNSNYREEKDAVVARQIALTLEREEQQKDRELRERMRLQLRMDDEVAQIEAEREIQRRIQEEKDQVRLKINSSTFN